MEYEGLQSLEWVKEEHNWLSIKAAARYEGMSVTEYYEYLYKLERAHVLVLMRCDIDRNLEIYVGDRYEEFGDYYRLTPKAYRRWQQEREEQQKTVAYLQQVLRELGMNTKGLPRPQDFAIHPDLIMEN